MRGIRSLLQLALLIFLFLSSGVYGQNTSNKGTDFWVAYTGHVDGKESRLYLYLTSDVNTTASVTVGNSPIPGSPFTINANTVTPVLIDPNTIDAYLGSSDVVERGKAIHVTAARPVVVYSHIFRAARSASSLILPAKVLGREYYVSAYTQNSNSRFPVTYSEFSIIAVEDQTTIEITPKATDIAGRHAANVTYSITLQRGEAYQYQSRTDLSGSHLVSVAGSNGGCKPIAVFSGSSWLGFCNAQRESQVGGDNLYQQLYPVTSWGKEFITAPFINRPFDVFRIYFSRNNTTAAVNGIPRGVFNKGDYYDFSSSTANRVTASEPISLVQYQVSQDCDPRNAGTDDHPVNPGDPEMTVLNPVEQTLSKITVYSALANQTSPPTQITQHYINVIIRDDDKSSFRINGQVPSGVFVPVGASGYVYLQEDVTARSLLRPTHTLTADGGFSAIAYGYGHVESYGYLAGADVKNLFQNIEISNVETGLKTTEVCVGRTSALTLTLPYQTERLSWTIDGQVQAPVNRPVPEVIQLNGVTAYQYKYLEELTFNGPGLHQVKVQSLNPNPSGCDANEELVLDFEVFELPAAAFTGAPAKICANQAVRLSDDRPASGKPIVKWHWDFGDGTFETRTSGAAFDHVYPNAGDFEIRLTVESEAGCASAVSTPFGVHVNAQPVADFEVPLACATQMVRFTDRSLPGAGRLLKWHWDFGDALQTTPDQPNTSEIQHPLHLYRLPGTYKVLLMVENEAGCVSVASEQMVTVYGVPDVDFELPEICMTDGPAIFKNLSSTGNWGAGPLRYEWDFGDPASGILNAATTVDGQHQYRASGTYRVQLRVFNGSGCGLTIIKNLVVNGANPIAAFEVLDRALLCSDQRFQVKDRSSVDAGSITRLQWFLDEVMILEVLQPSSGDTYTFSYPSFSGGQDRPANLRLKVFSGSLSAGCQDTKTEQLFLKPVPDLNFEMDVSRCVNAGPLQLTATELSQVDGTMSFSGPGVDGQGMFYPERAGVGVHLIRCRFISENGCAIEVLHSITVSPMPSVDAGADMVILAGGERRMNATATGLEVSFRWSPAAGLERDDLLNPIARPERDTEYTLTVTSKDGCTATDRVFVKVLDEIVPPNAFSPNGDGRNDVWNLPNLDSYPNVTVDIFNRYGEKVFHSKNYFIPFDGNYRNQALPVGTYYYLIDPGNGRKRISGSLTLIR
ncbi:bacterial Ig-like domain protein [Pedobacter sp. BAL39]|uniref:PKD domain-containing protein n=1 Tax=Pedobacter sp. BAL39 TaxID=391596 RepID=UPI0001559CFF|nr:PKD domain-containing protein [Pedobacter sp. BAL39]EDM36541.1 bacterial Ig-like domain protein [Pedobacter sp. BAL39]